MGMKISLITAFLRTNKCVPPYYVQELDSERHCYTIRAKGLVYKDWLVEATMVRIVCSNKSDNVQPKSFLAITYFPLRSVADPGGGSEPPFPNGIIIGCTLPISSAEAER